MLFITTLQHCSEEKVNYDFFRKEFIYSSISILALQNNHPLIQCIYASTSSNHLISFSVWPSACLAIPTLSHQLWKNAFLSLDSSVLVIGKILLGQIWWVQWSRYDDGVVFGQKFNFAFAFFLPISELTTLQHVSCAKLQRKWHSQHFKQFFLFLTQN